MKKNMAILRSCYHGVTRFFPFLQFLLSLIFRKLYKFPFINKYSGKIFVLANGPSLKLVTSYLASDDEFKKGEFIVMNMFALDDSFLKIRPKHYCFSDPMFYQDYFPRLKEIKRTFEILQNDVNWEMNLYVCFFTRDEVVRFYNYSKLKNPNIKIIPMNRVSFRGYECLRNYFYSTGLTMPLVGNVANLAIYISLLSGYKDIRVYGVDHDFFLSWSINDKNELCSKELHFYQDNENIKLKPIIDTIKGHGTVKIADYLYGLSVMFKSHDYLEQLSKYLGANILNCTPHSMIDSYNRIKLK